VPLSGTYSKRDCSYATFTPRLAKMSLVASFRLSVQPVLDEEWAIVCKMGAYKG
jgi:predicted RNA-binding protein with PUA-like domain